MLKSKSNLFLSQNSEWANPSEKKLSWLGFSFLTLSSQHPSNYRFSHSTEGRNPSVTFLYPSHEIPAVEDTGTEVHICAIVPFFLWNQSSLSASHFRKNIQIFPIKENLAEVSHVKATGKRIVHSMKSGIFYVLRKKHAESFSLQGRKQFTMIVLVIMTESVIIQVVLQSRFSCLRMWPNYLFSNWCCSLLYGTSSTPPNIFWWFFLFSSAPLKF